MEGFVPPGISGPFSVSLRRAARGQPRAGWIVHRYVRAYALGKVFIEAACSLFVDVTGGSRELIRENGVTF